MEAGESVSQIRGERRANDGRYWALAGSGMDADTALEVPASLVAVTLRDSGTMQRKPT